MFFFNNTKKQRKKTKVSQRRVPESDLLQVERVLDDARGGHAHAQNVLLGRQVVGRCDAI